MISEALQFWNSVSGKIAGLIRNETKNAFRCERYEVTTAPNGTQIGVTLPYGSNQLFIPYSKEVATASVGDTVLVVWWGSMSNAKAYYFANGYEGTESAAGGGVIATITIPLAWNDSGNGYHTATPTITGAAISSNNKITLQPTASMQLQLRSSGVESLYVENNSGTLTAYAVGNAPTTALSMQCTVAETEGAQSGSAIVGDTSTVPDGVVELFPTVTRTSGVSSFSSIVAYRDGHTVFVKLVLNSGNSSVSTGSNAFVGTVSGLPLPPEGAIGVSYLNQTAFMCNLSHDGTITVRVTAASKNASTTSTYGISWTYITLED